MDGDSEAADPEYGRWHGSLPAIGDTSTGKELFVEKDTMTGHNKASRTGRTHDNQPT
ncbi:hypothetical protein AB0395_16325 [Streptosporangium sp. NPDC051023]|uniref:hypothetical protein n=1 Tax=Streptosporangium sp. NPDC051023 TaxID=3155410 RepID=UPI00344CBC9E